jgi:P4 family phage/plasmid primase-like protien
LRAQKITQWSPDASAKAEHVVADIARRFGPPGWFGKNGNCQRLNERFWAELFKAEQEIIHERDEERFYQYDPQSGLWQVRTANAIKAAISDRIRSLSLKYAPGLLVQDTEHNRRNIVALLRGVSEERDFFVERPLAIHARNCMILIEDGQIKVEEFDSRFRSRNQLSVDYEPEAKAPRFTNELLTPVTNPADRGVIKKMLGLVVSGVNRAQRIFILIGEGNTGKTTLLLVAKELIGKWNCVELRPHLLGERFELSRTLGKTLYVGPDVPGNFLQNVGAARLKSLVGHDPMDAERKNSNEHFPFRGSLNVLITANTRLLVRLHGDHSAWLRRLVMIHFDGQSPRKRIENFAELLVETEGAGILNLAIEGLVNFEADWEQHGDLVLSPEQLSRVESLLTESEGLRIFLESELEQDSEADLSVDEILSSYATFAREKGWQVVSVRNLQAQLKDLMLEVWSAPQAHSLKRNDKSVRGYYGIRLK